MSHRRIGSGKQRGGSAIGTAMLRKFVKDGRVSEAEKLATKILQKDSRNPDALRACIVAATNGGRFSDAIDLCERLCLIRPEDYWPRMSLGVCRMQLGDLGGALEHLAAAEAMAPDSPDVCGHLSSCFFRSMDFERSLVYADRSIEADPTNFSAHNARGGALLKLLRYQEALLSLAKAIELFPGEYYEDAVFNLGLTLHDMGCHREAYACHEQMLARDPADVGSRALFVHSAMHLCQWDGMADHGEALLAAIRGEGPPLGIPPFIFLGIPNYQREDHRIIALLAAETMLATKVCDRPELSSLSELMPRRQRVRIGYLSADFHQHATSQLMVEVIEKHDRRQFEIFAYSYGPDDGSAMRKRMLSAFDTFRDLQSMSWCDAAEVIRGDELDILVDLKGWTRDTRLELVACRPAPVVVSWLGYPGTLGHPGMADYIIGDRYVTPLEHASGYSETIIQLPHTYQPNDRMREVGETPSRETLGLPDDAVVYCSFNQAYKINDLMFSRWCEILRQVPNSVLWLLQPDAHAEENLGKEIERAGIERSRLIFAPRINLSLHLGRLRQASIALDTAPYGSHTTGSDALWVGVPIVTCPGETFASRVAASLLVAAELPELIAESLEDYVDLAVRLGNDPVRLAGIKQKLMASREMIPLFDSSRFVRNLEKAYRSIVDDARAGRREPIVVSEE